ncbi:MAG: hypothetical protein LH645_02865 [Actinomycetia bacterium]|nr:hypothetical protein [Actinomycetes bacterium]
MVVVTALNDPARTWWTDRLGFTPFDPNGGDNYDLYLPTTVIAATLETL